MTATAIPTVREQHTSRFAPVPLGRVVRVELRKMFNWPASSSSPC